MKRTMKHILCGVACAALILLPAAALAQESVDSLRRAYFEAYQSKDWPSAIEIGLKLVERDPANSHNAYNLACAYGLSGDAENALIWARKAAEAGFSDRYLFETDPDLKPIRTLPGYPATLEIVRQHAARDRAAFLKLAEKSTPLIVVPEDLDRGKPAPLIVALHPYGGTAEQIAGVWRSVAQKSGAILVAPRAVRPTGVGRAAGFEWGTADEADYLVTSAVKVVLKEHKIDEQRIVLTGFSQGAYIAFNLGIRHPDKFAGVIPVAGSYNSSEAGPALLEGARRPRFYVMVGDRDPILEANRTAAKEYQKAGIPVQLKVYENLGHTFPKNTDEELHQAMKFVLGE
ncbi:MAG: dienelactone hydrolase family protein [Planctomycetes bacterium]|nr:dienelactone hydrolase family protein [Planctomycetota bacterium]